MAETYGAKLELRPLTDLNQAEVITLGEELTAMVAKPETRRELEYRQLKGVIRRHTSAGLSTSNILLAQTYMERSGHQVFGLWQPTISEARGTWVGMGSVMPNLPLRKPLLPLFGVFPAALTRKVGFLAPSQEMTGPNVQAWVDGSLMQDVTPLASAYKALAEEGGEGSWTLEPGLRTLAGQAILSSGMSYGMGAARYDDYETGDIQPIRYHFVYRPDHFSEGN